MDKKILFRIFLYYSFVLFVTIGCSKNNNTINTDSTEQIEAVQATPEQCYDVYWQQKEIASAPYEAKGCLLGAYISEDKLVNGNIEAFEEITGREHAIYAQKMYLGQPFPLQWVLECYTYGKIPMILLYPENIYQFSNDTYLEQTAEEFGMLNIPIFLQPYPNPTSYQVDSEQYIQAFEKMRIIFQEKAPNVAFIWSVSSNAVIESQKFYPGPVNVDYIGINCYQNQGEEQKLFTQLEYFYFTYQKEKPLMVSQLGISHYSTDQHRYDIATANKTLTDFYDSLRKYPRIKAVIYMDASFGKAPKETIRNDYTITGESSLVSTYQNITKKGWFSNSQSSPTAYCLYRSPFCAYWIDNTLYINEKTAVYDLALKKIPDTIPIDKNHYFPWKEESNWSFRILEANKSIIFIHNE